jgi:hypothetical protein
MKILIGFEESGKVRDAFIRKGHDAISCDLLPSRSVVGPHIQGDIRPLLSQEWDAAIMFPPCTDLCVSGARWFKKKQESGQQQAAIELFMSCTKVNAKKWAIENPIGIMSRLYKKPDQIIQPWWFGHGETKSTCLWMNGFPLLIPTNAVDGREQRIWKMAPGENRARDRSETYQGIADAMASQWG